MLANFAKSGCRCLKLHPLSLPLVQTKHLSGSIVTHWKAERYVSILTAGAFAGAVIVPCLAVDQALAVLIPLHTHWGLEQIFTDYLHVKLAKKLLFIFLKVVTAATILALLYFNQHDIGITQAVKDVWNIKRVQPEDLS